MIEFAKQIGRVVVELAVIYVMVMWALTATSAGYIAFSKMFSQ